MAARNGGERAAANAAGVGVEEWGYSESAANAANATGLSPEQWRTQQTEAAAAQKAEVEAAKKDDEERQAEIERAHVRLGAAGVEQVGGKRKSKRVRKSNRTTRGKKQRKKTTKKRTNKKISNKKISNKKRTNKK